MEKTTTKQIYKSLKKYHRHTNWVYIWLVIPKVTLTYLEPWCVCMYMYVLKP